MFNKKLMHALYEFNISRNLWNAFKKCLKAVSQLCRFYTYMHARKSLDPFQYYIWSKQMFWWGEFSIPYDLAFCFYLLNTNYL